MKSPGGKRPPAFFSWQEPAALLGECFGAGPFLECGTGHGAEWILAQPWVTGLTSVEMVEDWYKWSKTLEGPHETIHATLGESEYLRTSGKRDAVGALVDGISAERVMCAYLLMKQFKVRYIVLHDFAPGHTAYSWELLRAPSQSNFWIINYPVSHEVGVIIRGQEQTEKFLAFAKKRGKDLTAAKMKTVDD